MEGGGSLVCLAACESLGSAGGLIFALLALAWGELQRRRARTARAETEQLKQSLRPPAPQRVELVHISLPPGELPVPAPPRAPRELVDVAGPHIAPRSSSGGGDTS